MNPADIDTAYLQPLMVRVHFRDRTVDIYGASGGMTPEMLAVADAIAAAAAAPFLGGSSLTRRDHGAGVRYEVAPTPLEVRDESES